MRSEVITLINCLVNQLKQTTTFRQIGLYALSLRPDAIHIDFEQATINVTESMFPETRIKRCRFHLRQAWWHNIPSVFVSIDVLKLRTVTYIKIRGKMLQQRSDEQKDRRWTFCLKSFACMKIMILTGPSIFGQLVVNFNQ